MEHDGHNLFILPSSELCKVNYSLVVNCWYLNSSEALGLLNIFQYI